MELADYEQLAEEIYNQFFNPKYVDKDDMPHDTEMIVMDYADSMLYEKRSVDADILHHELLKMLEKEKPKWKK